MKLILKSPSGVDGFPAMPGARGITALDDEARDEAVEDGFCIVAIEAMLEKVPRGDGNLFGEELEEDISGGGSEEYFGRRLRLEIVQSGHIEQDRTISECLFNVDVRSGSTKSRQKIDLD